MLWIHLHEITMQWEHEARKITTDLFRLLIYLYFKFVVFSGSESAMGCEGGVV